MRTASLALGALAAAALVAPSALGGGGNTAMFTFMLTGDQENPPVSTDAFGSGFLTLDTTDNTFGIEVNVSGIELGDLMGAGPNSTPIHIHMAPPGMNGGIVVDIGWMGGFVEIPETNSIRLETNGFLFGGQQGNLFSDVEDNVAALFAGNLYVNIHTMAFPGGELRGQIIPAPAAGALLGVAGLAGLRRRRA